MLRLERCHETGDENEGAEGLTVDENRSQKG
jgi:hypothetical protein